MCSSVAGLLHTRCPSPLNKAIPEQGSVSTICMSEYVGRYYTVGNLLLHPPLFLQLFAGYWHTDIIRSLFLSSQRAFGYTTTLPPGHPDQFIISSRPRPPGSASSAALRYQLPVRFFPSRFKLVCLNTTTHLGRWVAGFIIKQVMNVFGGEESG